MLQPGTKAPLFDLVDQAGVTQSLQDQLGSWVLLYIYPQDDTPGCTQEACTIAEVYDEFEHLGVTVFGLSKDTVESHQKFVHKYNLPFTLLSDESMETIAAYEGLEVTQHNGETIRGTRRISYLIDPTGIIAKAYPEVDPANHALELLADCKMALQSQEL